MSSSKLLRNVKVFALAGGAGSRLMPLTATRAKPAVPFGGKWTIFDLVMWSLYHSGLRDVGVLVQKNNVSLTDHLAAVWPQKPGGGSYFQVLSPEGFDGRHQYLGTADAVWQHVHRADDAEHVMIVSGDHLFKVDFSQFYDYHVKKDADLSIMSITVPTEEARAFGVMGTNKDGRIENFKEKPEHPQEIPGKPGEAYCSMGVYLFKRDALEKYLELDAKTASSSHDFGKDVIPRMLRECCVYAYPFSENVAPGQKRPYWRDVGTIKAFWEEHMNLCSDEPELNLFSEQWPITTVHDRTPPAKFAKGCLLENSHVSGGSIIDRANIRYSVLGRRVHVRAGCEIDQSILFSQIIVEEKCKLVKTIVDVDPSLHDNQRVVIPAGTEIGVDVEEDEARGFTVTEEGITVVPFEWFKRNGRTIIVQ